MPSMDEDISPFPGFDRIQRRRRLMAELAEKRRELGLSQTEVAARMGTSQSTVARLEAGGGDIRLSSVERYAEAIGHAVEWRLRAEQGG
jgi:predicted transcriptional regulator